MILTQIYILRPSQTHNSERSPFLQTKQMTPLLSTSYGFQYILVCYTSVLLKHTKSLFQTQNFRTHALHKPKGLVHCAHLVTVQLHTMADLMTHCSPWALQFSPLHLLLSLPLANYNYVPVLWPLDRSFILQVAFNLLSYGSKLYIIFPSRGSPRGDHPIWCNLPTHKALSLTPYPYPVFPMALKTF